VPHKIDMSSPARGRRRSSFRRNKRENKRPFHHSDHHHRVSYNNSVSKKRKSQAFRVNRNTTCPLLLRLFPHLTTGPLLDGTPSRKPEEYSWYSRVGVHDDDDEGKPEFSEFRLYTWKDATLNELYGCVTRTVMESENEEMKRVLSDGDGKGVVMVFSLVYPDRNGKLVMRQIGRVSSEDTRTGGMDGGETLQRVGFEIGDFLDVAVLINADPS
jgi:hypothetical protein